MCTLTFVPRPNGSVVTANRDEDPHRAAQSLSTYQTPQHEPYLIAKEPLHGGTNFAVAQSRGVVAVLLNGAFHPYKMNRTFPHSRGLVVLDSLGNGDLYDFADRYDFFGVAPFTLFHFSDKPREIRWDGRDIHKRTYLPDRPFVVASAQMYSAEAQEKRRKWLVDFLRDNDPSPEALFHFHLTGGDGNRETDMVMNRNNRVRTVSVSQVSDFGTSRKVRHRDLLDGDENRWEFRG